MALTNMQIFFWPFVSEIKNDHMMSWAMHIFIKLFCIYLVEWIAEFLFSKKRTGHC